jgi:hypothetical protein
MVNLEQSDAAFVAQLARNDRAVAAMATLLQATYPCYASEFVDNNGTLVAFGRRYQPVLHSDDAEHVLTFYHRGVTVDPHVVLQEIREEALDRMLAEGREV